MEDLIIGVLLFGGLFITLFIGIPVGFAMAAVSLIVGYFFWGGEASIIGYILGSFSQIQHFTYVAVPLYILMAAILRYSDLADDMYDAVYKWMGGIKGGLAAGTIVISAIFGAMVGISSVATATLGIAARPSMVKRGYDEEFTAGAIMGGGNLGIIIPPSVIMIIYATVAEVSAGQMFMSGVVPGILGAVIFIIYCIVYSYISPNKGPALPREERFTLIEKFVSLKGIVLPVFIMVCVLVSIFFGIATPTEAAVIGVAGSLIAAGIKRKLTIDNIMKMLKMTVNLSIMVFWLILGSIAFARVVQGTGVGSAISNLVTGMDLNRWIIYVAMLIILFVLGMFIDGSAILFITGPIFLPILSALDFDLVWYGLIFVLFMAIAHLTPPFGISLFVYKGVVPEVSMMQLYRSMVPFVILYLFLALLVTIFPQLALWLPSIMYN